MQIEIPFSLEVRRRRCKAGIIMRKFAEKGAFVIVVIAALDGVGQT